MTTTTEQYIFDKDTDTHFYEFIEQFHTTFVDDLIMTGTDRSHVHIEKVPMSTMGNDREFCAHVLGGMLKEKPMLHIKFMDVMCCNMYSLCNDDDVDGVYLYQCVYDYPRDNYNFYSIWNCKKPDLLHALYYK